MKVLNIDWLEENSNRKYPFYDFSTLKDQSNTFTIPNDFLVDLTFIHLYDSDINLTQFYLKEIIHSSSILILNFYYGSNFFINFRIDKSQHTKNKTYTNIKDGFYQVITIQTLDTINKQPYGKFTFDLEATRLLPHCIKVFLSCVRKINIIKAGVVQHEYYGSVSLEAGANIQLARTGNKIEISAISDAELNLIDECMEQLASSPPIRTINGITPDEYGNINLVGLDGISIDTEGNNIKIKDEFCKPCCGDEEIKIILEKLKDFASKAITFENFLNNMQQKLLELQLVVNGSNKAADKCHD